MTVGPPAYLLPVSHRYAEDPRAAALAWFREARYGLFLHYGLYSLLGRHEWVQYREKIPVAEYAKLAARFTAERFDAEAICELALAAGMRYVNLTTRHHDSFCLFDSAETEFKSTNTPCGRDLAGELAAACDRHGLGFFAYYSHGRDWRHPHAPNNGVYGTTARPQYPEPDPAYATGDAHRLELYLEFMTRQITELCTRYGPLAGVWLDGIATPLAGDWRRFRCQTLYDLIHRLQPQILVSYKQGLLGTEDFVAPEHRAIEVDKPGEICTTMSAGWGYMESERGRHKSAEQVWDMLAGARRRGYNLLLNTAPLPDGSLDPEDTAVLRAVGERLRRDGFPGEE